MANEDKQLVTARDLPLSISDKPPELTEAQGKIALRLRDISWMMEAIAGGINEAITKATEPLKQRITELEQRPTVKYVGIWREGKVYASNSMVTDQGSVWFTERATLTRPGSSDNWVLAVKRGRDGKDGRL